MRKSVKVLAAAFLLCMLLMPIQASAAAVNGRLTVVDTRNVRVALQMPEGNTEAVTSLRLCLSVTVDEGSMENPYFQFAGSISSTVQDVDISRADNTYRVDIIISGKPDQKIFPDQDTAEIGTLVLSPSVQTNQTFRATVDFYKEGPDGAVISYVDSAGQTPFNLALSSEPVTVTNVSGGSGGPYYPGAPNQKPQKPDDTTGQKPPAEKPDGTGSTDKEPNQGQETSFAVSQKPKLRVSVKNGSRMVSLKWKKIAYADGYRIYQYDSKRHKFIAIKTIKDNHTTAYAVKLAYAASKKFRIRAYALAEDGSKILGHVSNTVNAVTAPKAVQGLTIRHPSSRKTVLSWTQSKKADGYQVLYSTKKAGNYKSLHMVKKPAKVQYTMKPKGGKNYYYKVRAYKIRSDGTRIYSKYSQSVY